MYFFEISVITCLFMYIIFEIINKARLGSLIYNISGLPSQEPLITPSVKINTGSLEFQAGKKKKENENDEEKDDDDIDDDKINDDWDDDDDWDEEEDLDDDEEFEEECWEEEVIKSKNKQDRIC